ncbi:GrpB family protein [Microbacterium sp. 69-10]|uniref:GrpB family protein n=1 Tax=Microbacterium sp. 69-10 TaxID=1895783 RepID=UPI000AC82F4F|nr:GrpB family protein [Microbacterium sp. 69-10]
MPRTPASRLADALRDADLGLRRGVVDLAPASDAWARAFAGIHEVLAETAPPSVVAIEHIGSTSVPGLDAKPILDVGIAVHPGTPLASLDGWLTGLGMLLRGDATDVRPDRMYGYELEPMIRLANVHVVEAGSEDLRRYLAFRDHLRAHPADRDAYGALKHALAGRHPDDRLAYIDGKADFITTRRGD